MKPLVIRPEASVRSQKGGAEQMQVHISDTSTEEPLSFEEFEHLLMRRRHGLRKLAQRLQREVAARQVPDGDLSKDERVTQHPALLEQIRELRIAVA